MKRAWIAIVGVLFLLPQAASAVITFSQLDDDVFVVSHRIKVVGSRGRAMKLVYEKAASLCLAAGFSHYKILEQESDAGQQYESANASVQVQYYFEDGDGRLECEKTASTEYVQQAREKLARIGYVKPDPPEERAAEAASSSEACTVDQITAMVRAGLSDEQIKAACPPSD